MPSSSPEAVNPLADVLAGRGKLAGRYLAVSIINIFNSQALLYIANSIWGWPGGWANVFAAILASIPAYLLSRAWVWEKRGGHSMRREVLPFWVITFVGLVVSSVAAALADRQFGAGLLVNVASLGAYFIVWVAKFVLLDHLFSQDPQDDELIDGDPVDETHRA